MDFLDFVVDVLYHLSFVVGYKSDFDKGNTTKKLEPTLEQESYVICILATAIAICFEDDEYIDKTERRLIKKTIRKVPYKLSRETRKYIYRLVKDKIDFYELKILYKRRGLDDKMIFCIFDELERVLKNSNQNLDLQISLINDLRTEYLTTNKNNNLKEEGIC